MALFSGFSNDTADRAAALANAGRQQGYNDLSTQYGLGRDAINTGYGSAETVLGRANNTFRAGANTYGDVSGANGVEGLARGTDLWRNSGQYGVYGVALNEGLGALDRTHAAAGNLSSGNADTDAMRYAADQATKSWGTFQAGLQPYLGAYGSSSQNLANAYAGQGNALNTSYTNQGNAANTTQTAIGANNAGAEMNNYNVAANQWNAAMGVAKLVAGLPPGTFGGTTGTGASSIGSAFSPSGSNPFNPDGSRNTMAYNQPLFTGFG